MKKYTLIITEENEYIFDAIRDGRKKVETRAGSVKYKNIQAGDILAFSCDGKTFEKYVTAVHHFASIPDLLKTYSPEDINPKARSEE